MAELDKVIKGLECCTKYGSMCGLHCDGYAGWANGTIVQYEDHHEECPYFKCETGCVITLARDALELLKHQKWHFFHVRELTEEEKIDHPDWVSITECDDYEPNNGEEFLYYRKCFNSIGIDTWDDDMWADYACTGDGENIEDGDAWMELPEKPYRR